MAVRDQGGPGNRGARNIRDLSVGDLRGIISRTGNNRNDAGAKLNAAASTELQRRGLLRGRPSSSPTAPRAASTAAGRSSGS